MRPDDELRPEVIDAITASGVRLVRENPFGSRGNKDPFVDFAELGETGRTRESP